MNNSKYIFSKAIKENFKILAVLVLFSISKVLVPLFGIFIPSVFVAILLKPESKKLYFILILIFLIRLFLEQLEVYCSHIYLNLSRQIKVSFIADLLLRKSNTSYQYDESEAGRNEFNMVMGTLLNDNKSIIGFLQNLPLLISSYIILIFQIFMLGKVDILLSLSVLLLSVLEFFINKRIQLKQDEFYTNGAGIGREIESIFNFNSNIKNKKDIKFYKKENVLDENFNNSLSKKEKFERGFYRYVSLIKLNSILMFSLKMYLSYVYLISKIYSSSIDFAVFTFFIGIVSSFSIYINQAITSTIEQKQRDIEISYFVNYGGNDPYKSDENKVLLDKDIESIELKNLTLELDSNVILKDINYKVGKNTSVAIIGSNGAGKSTLVKLLCGLYVPTSGEILINGKNINTFNKLSLYRAFAPIFQEINIYPSSVRNNISFNESNDEEIDKCLSFAGLDFLKEHKDENLTKMLSSEGIVLSGGQEQRIILARAFHKLLFDGASVLLLDEPTSAMDIEGEKELYEKYSEIIQNKISFFVSHRLASTKFCDKIIVLDKGQLVESGSAHELMELEGIYFDMFSKQKSKFI